MRLGKILNETFGMVYIKNLPESTERKRLIKESFDKVGLKYEIENAFDGREFVAEDFKFRHNKREVSYPASAGFFGGQLSTIRTMLNEISKGSESCILCDDDCFVRETDFLSVAVLETIKTNLPEDWEIVLFSDLKYDGPINSIKEFTYFRCDKCWSQAAGSHAIAIRSSVYKPFLLELIMMDKWGDRCVGEMIEQNRKVYGIIPNLIMQDRNQYSVMNRTFHNNYIIPRNV